jgi:glycerol-1-phosphate dehydrogenase [NAD(P)+]
MNVEPIDATAWQMVQGNLRAWLSDPEGVRAGKPQAIRGLIEGLMICGFAMQLTRNSRVASGAEHQFSHLWDMEHHTHNGIAPSHGEKVGIGSIAIARLYESLLKRNLDGIEIEGIVKKWPDSNEIDAQIASLFDTPETLEVANLEKTGKAISRELLREQLQLLQSRWRGMKQKVEAQLPARSELSQMLAAVGAPNQPEQIGISQDRLKRSYKQAYFTRRRYTVLDLAARAGVLDECLDEISG